MLIYAHRGNSSVYPENTMSAFRSAIDLGVHGIETDVHLTKDGELVITHDEEISRVSDGKGMIKDLTYKELLAFDFGSWKGEEYKGEKIVKLTQLLDLLENQEIMLNIEIKMGFLLYPGIEEKLLEVLTERGFLHRIIFSSFNHYSLAKLKSLNPDALVAPLYQSGLYEPYNYALTFGASFIHPYYMAMDRSIVEESHKKNIKVNLWTVNDTDKVSYYKDLGIDGLITDYPEELLTKLKEL
ncbi:MAG TPA: glycerophosphodiester phosphodiesterase [Proteiniclasticum sp.]|nr:glycerophosphodiester phosphodiesterase [Proteiniclasticum sp.]